MIGRRLEMADAVAELNPADDLRQAVPAVRFPPFRLRGHHELEGGGPVFRPRHPLVRLVRCLTVANVLDRVRRPNVFPVFGREVVERQQGVMVLDQLGHHFVPLHAIGFDEEVEGNRGRERVSACQMSCRCALAFDCTDFGSALSTFMAL